MLTMPPRLPLTARDWAPLCQAETTGQLLRAATMRVAASPWVQCAPVALEAFPVGGWSATATAHWTERLPPALRDPDLPLLTETHLAEFGIAAAWQGGFWHQTARGPRGWTKDGSGAAQATATLEALRLDGTHPGWNPRFAPAWDEGTMRTHLQHLESPYPADKAAAYAEWQEEARVRAVGEIIGVTPAEWAGDPWGWHTVRQLQHTCPASFGGDPLGKKAVLFLIFVHGWWAARGQPVPCDLPLAADYTLPRLALHTGLLELHPEAAAHLAAPRCLPQDDALLLDLRCATVLVGRRLADRAGIPDLAVDTELFRATRNRTDFRHSEVPRIRPATFWL